jgi:hypothetical protein
MDIDNNDVRLVGKKSKAPLYLILALLALIILGLLAWKSMHSDDNRQQNQPQTVQQQNAGDVRDIAGVYGVQNANDLNGRNLDLNDVTVSRVVSDRLFYVHQGTEAQQLLVYLTDALDEGNTEGQVRVKAGDTLSLKGELAVPANVNLDNEDDYAKQEAELLRGERVFLKATRTGG